MKKIFLIDAFNLIYRMFYAVPPMHTHGEKPVNAVYGVAKFLLSLWEDPTVDELIIASDGEGESVRSEIFSEYKATRDRMPDDLRSQLDDIFTLFTLLQIPILEAPGYEADDMIGSFATEILSEKENTSELIIISSDKDLCQFISDGKVRIFDAMKQKNITRKEVKEKFHVEPEQIADYLAIVGDTSDNIPGISGFGPKKAEELLGAYGSLSGIYDHLDDLPEKIRDTLILQKEKAFLSFTLASIHTNLPIEYDTAMSRFDSSRVFWNPEIITFFQEREFTSLLPLEYQKKREVFTLPDFTDISDSTILEKKLHALHSQKGELLIVTEGSRFSLDSVLFFLDETYYRVRTKDLEIREILVWLLASDISLIGYDITSDLERIEGYISLGNSEIEGQMQLF